MKVVFRVDASRAIGHGHVYRCLTLADALRNRRAEVEFISRRLPGNLGGLINQSGYTLHELPTPEGMSADLTSRSQPKAQMSLGVGIERDWKETAGALRQIGLVDLLVVDHYSLDQEWEAPIRHYCKRILVIDDLADRPHDADILVDQTLGRKTEEYHGLVPGSAEVLTGNSYVMVRAEFRRWRSESLARRLEGSPASRIQVALGGAGPERAYLTIMDALSHLRQPFVGTVEIVLGVRSNIVESLYRWAHTLPYKTEICAGVANMAQRMTFTHLGIGAAGTTSWERCCLGLPSIIIVMADNQARIAEELEAAGAARVVGRLEEVLREPKMLSEAMDPLLGDGQGLSLMSRRAAALVDGNGAERVCDAVL